MPIICLPDFLKTKKVKCKDGSKKEVYRHVDYIYPLENKDFKSNFEAAFKMAQQIDGRLEANFGSVVSHVFLSLDEANRNYIAECRHIYSVFQADPCKCHIWYANESRELLTRENKLREQLINLKREISRINDQKDVSSKKNDLLKEFTDIMSRYSRLNTPEEFNTDLQNVKDLITDWLTKQNGGVSNNGR